MANPMGSALSMLNKIAASETIDKIGMRKPLEKLVYAGTKTGFSAISAANRQFKPLLDVVRPTRMRHARTPDLFDLNFTDEQAMFRDTVRRLVDERVIPVAATADEERATPRALLDQIHALGVSLMAVPEELGGAGVERDEVLHMILAEELGRGDMGIATAALAPLGVINALTQWGTANQQAKYLAAFASESFVPATVALNEASVLFDPFQLQTTARRTADGYELNGEKTLVPLAEDSALFLVAAKLTGEGPRLFIVEPGMEGVSCRPDPAMGLGAAATQRLLLEQVKLPREALLGDIDTAFDYEAFIQLTRIGWSAVVTGCCQAVLDYVIPYVKDREAFGEPIAFRQSVAFMVANIGIELEGLRLLVYRAASRAAQDKSFAREAYIAYLQASEKGMQIGTDGVQLLGGHGFTKEHPVERWYRNLRSAGIQYNAFMV